MESMMIIFQKQVRIFKKHRFIVDLLRINKLKSIDISQNDLEKASGRQIARMLKDQVSNLFWIDYFNDFISLSGNFFDNQTTINQNLMHGLKNQRGLQHFGVSVRGAVAQQAIRLFSQKQTLRSIALKASQITPQSSMALTRILENPSIYITAISLRYTILMQDFLAQIAHALMKNRTLVKLDLSRCGIDKYGGRKLVSELKNNLALTQLDLSGNLLNDQFAYQLARMLEVNNVLYECNIAENKIGVQGGKEILRVLTQKNETLGSLGDLTLCYDMGIRVKQQLRQCLMLNSAPPELKRAMSSAKASELLSEIELDQKSMKILKDLDCKICKPISFTNKMEGNTELALWNI